MANEQKPIAILTVRNPKSLDDVAKWAALAQNLGFGLSCEVSIETLPYALSVYAWLSGLPTPEEDDEP